MSVHQYIRHVRENFYGPSNTVAGIENSEIFGSADNYFSGAIGERGQEVSQQIVFCVASGHGRIIERGKSRGTFDFAAGAGEEGDAEERFFSGRASRGTARADRTVHRVQNDKVGRIVKGFLDRGILGIRAGKKNAQVKTSGLPSQGLTDRPEDFMRFLLRVAAGPSTFFSGLAAFCVLRASPWR